MGWGPGVVVCLRSRGLLAEGQAGSKAVTLGGGVTDSAR